MSTSVSKKVIGLVSRRSRNLGDMILKRKQLVNDLEHNAAFLWFQITGQGNGVDPVLLVP